MTTAGRGIGNRLRELEGDWIGEETVAPTPWYPRGGPAIGRSTARMALGGRVLVTDYVEERDGKIILEGHGIYAWEAQDVYRMYWFDTSGPAPDAPVEGRWIDDTIAFERAAPNGRVRYVYVVQLGGDVYDFRIERQLAPARGGETPPVWDVLMQGRYRRA
jgi:hypothetical protein